MRLIASRQLRGNYGLVAPGQQFEPADEIAESLLKRGLARQYETKDEVPSEYETKDEVPSEYETKDEVPSEKSSRRAKNS